MSSSRRFAVLALVYAALGTCLTLSVSQAAARRPVSEARPVLVSPNPAEAQVDFALPNSMLTRAAEFSGGFENLIQTDTSSVAGTGGASQPKADVDDEPEFRETVWNIREGSAQLIGVEVSWTAEESASEKIITRAHASRPAVDPSVQSLRISDSEDRDLRQRISRLALAMPPEQLTRKSACPHWIEIETPYGQRFFCDGSGDAYDARPAVDLLGRLNRLMGSQGLR